MDDLVQIWAVDVSAYDLWKGNEKGERLIASCLANAAEEQAKVKRFIREIDQIRSLAGKLLVRLAVTTLKKTVSWNEMLFQTTKEGRPFLSFPVLDFDYNITHDGDWVAIAFSGSGQDQDQIRAPVVGVDVMEIHLPRFAKTVGDFVDTMDITLTPRERNWIMALSTADTFVTHCQLPPSLDRVQYEQLKRLYILWTYKEAYTKSKGLGLSHDFQDIDIDRRADSVTLKLSGMPEYGLNISEIVLPPGQSRNRRSGAGTGLESLLVVLRTNSNSNKNNKGEEVTLRTMEAEAAEKEGILRRWTMDGLVDASKVAISDR
ncbi:hypothetical protein CBS101457_004528 [Exobasidium rhododendri]|nr:hypothetical protein CBS101457_004528 [Exobasidium rhododendri]